MTAKDIYPLIVIGGGPAGLFCASRAAGHGKKVLVLEKNSSPGRKLLMSGSGQCNITHDGDILSFLGHYGDNGKFLKPALLNFQNRDLISFLAERHIPVLTEPSGRIFPASRNAKSVLDILEKECAAGNVEIRCGASVQEISGQEGTFLVRTARDKFSAGKVAIATGGITYPQTGSAGDGFAFARYLGHKVTDLGTALTAVTIKDYQFTSLSGISFREVTISLMKEGKKARQLTGDLLFTHTGLSGPAILDLSRHIRRGDILRVSFLPGVNTSQANEVILARINESGTRQVRKILQAFDLPERFVRKILDLAKIDQEQTGAHLSREARVSLLELLTGCPFIVARLGGIDEAMVTRGGVSLDEINPKTMESRLVPGLFFIGEVLDIDGDTGGYNLQAAFSTAAIAAKKISAAT
jgi:predicted Rossmann fold flavoprotein